MKFIITILVVLYSSVNIAVPINISLTYGSSNVSVDYSKASWRDEIVGVDLYYCTKAENDSCTIVQNIIPPSTKKLTISGVGLWRLQFIKNTSYWQTTATKNIKWSQYITVLDTPDLDIINIAKKYTPKYSFHNAEEYFPVSIKDLFNRNFGGNVSTLSLVQASSVMPTDNILEFLRFNGHEDNKMAMKNTVMSTLKGDKNNFPTYWFHQKLHNQLFITYFNLYGFDIKYNDYIGGAGGLGASFGSHSIDRESITIEFDIVNGLYKPKTITYAAHLPEQPTTFLGCSINSCVNPGNQSTKWTGGKTTVNWENASKINNNPIIYIAHGSHAVMPAFGWYHTLVSKPLVTDLISVTEPAGNSISYNISTPTLYNIDLNNPDHSALNFSGYLINGAPLNWYKIFPFVRYPIKEWVSESNKIFNDCVATLTGCEKYINRASQKVSQITTTQSSTTLTASLKNTLSKTLAFLGIRDAVAAALPSLFAYTNSNFTVRVEGTGFDGNEAVSVEGATCSPASIVRGSGYFTQNCVAGGVASDTNKVRVYDTQYDLDIDVPTEYQLMSLRGPVLAPLAPTLTDLGNGTVRSSWNTVTGATSYELYRGTTKVATLGAVTQYDELGLTAGSQACYRVKAIANGTASALSGESCITVPIIVVQCAGQWNVNKYAVGAVESTTQACSAGYTGNKVLSHTCQASGSWGVTTTQDNCTLTVAPTCTGTWNSGVKYLVNQVEDVYQNTCPAGTQGQVRSFHTCLSANNWSATAQSDNCTAYLATPTDVQVSNVAGGIQITWAAVSGATGYKLYKQHSNGTYRDLGSITNYVDNYVTVGSTYKYAVAAVSTYNNQNVTSPVSAWSPTIVHDIGTGINPPTNVQASPHTQYTQKGIRLSWVGAPAADSYLIYRRGYNNPYTSAAFLAPVAGSDISFFDIWSNFAGSVVTGQSYCYYIRAVRNSTNSVESNEACAMAP